MAPSVAQAIFEATHSTNPEAYRFITFEQWVAFLQNGNLITVAPTGNFVLTTYGRGFLNYLYKERLPLPKPL